MIIVLAAVVRNIRNVVVNKYIAEDGGLNIENILKRFKQFDENHVPNEYPEDNDK